MTHKKTYNCLYNHELSIIASTQTPYQSYDENIKLEQVEGFVHEISNTQVDAFMCCPTALKRLLWPSKIDTHWKTEAPYIKEPLPEHDWKYYEKMYYRLARYILAGNDPVGQTLNAAKRSGVDFFISYRMNDAHYMNIEESLTHSTFWRENPQWRIGENTINNPYVSSDGSSKMLNYLYPEVRQYYYSILEELTEMYDIDGMELDLMRSPYFFPVSKLEEGTAVMTQFVTDIRNMLERYSTKRNKQLQLCVRVPATIKLCKEAGLDVVHWDTLGLVDMINVSSYYIHSMKVDVEGFHNAIQRARIYGEMQVATGNDKTTNSAGVGVVTVRKTTKEIYETTAYNFLEQGADGISFFNFCYTRDHSFNEPRRANFPGEEPPFEVLKNICNKDYLAGQPKHYFVSTGSQLNTALCTMNLRDDVKATDHFHKAVLRVECSDNCRKVQVEVYLNDVELEQFEGSGELFDPLSIEALPPISHVRYYKVPLTLLQKGDNTILVSKVFTGREQTGYRSKPIFITRIELAIYTKKGLLS